MRGFFAPLLMMACTPLLALPAQAIDFAALGGLNFAAPTQRQSGGEIHWTGDPGLSFGATVALPLFDLPFELEAGAFFLNENSSRAGLSDSRKNTMLQLPLVLRFNLDEHIGLGVGGYVSFAHGKVETTTGGVTTSSSFADASEETVDSGLIANVRAKFNLAPPFYFILDGRYQHGLFNQSVFATDMYHTRSVQIFAGFQFSLVSSPAEHARGNW